MRPATITLAIVLGLAVASQAEPLSVASPAGIVTVSVDVVDGRAVYAVLSRGTEVIRPSTLGLVLEGAARLDSNLEVASHSRSETRSSWKPVYGERSEFPDRFNALTVELRERIPPGWTLVVEFRAYDEGVAFRYQVPSQPRLATFVIGGESTEFRLARGAFAWVTPDAQALYERVAIEDMTRLSERPLLVETATGTGTRTTTRPTRPASASTHAA